MQIKHGTNRVVILIGRYAIKLPTCVSWKLFLTGLLGNMQEKLFSDTKWDQLCPVIFSMPGGWLNVMPRAEPLEREAFFNLDFDKWIKVHDGESVVAIVPVENKLDSFGTINGKIVAIDYGS